MQCHQFAEISPQIIYVGVQVYECLHIVYQNILATIADMIRYVVELRLFG